MDFLSLPAGVPFLSTPTRAALHCCATPLQWHLKVSTASHTDIDETDDQANHSNHILHHGQDPEVHFSQGI